MASHGWLARVFGTEGAPDRPRTTKGSKALRAAPLVEKRSCANCASSVSAAAHRCPHCGYRLVRPDAPRAEERLGGEFDDGGTPLAISLQPGATGGVALDRAGGA